MLVRLVIVTCIALSIVGGSMGSLIFLCLSELTITFGSIANAVGFFIPVAIGFIVAIAIGLTIAIIVIAFRAVVVALVIVIVIVFEDSLDAGRNRQSDLGD
jgi:hypothetical protein